MITMQKRGEPAVQSFGLQLKHIAQESDTNNPESIAKVSEKLKHIHLYMKCQIKFI